MNGKPVCTASIPDAGATSVGLTWVQESRHNKNKVLTFKVGGVDMQSEEFLEWDVRPINVDDKITIEIADTDRIDQPTRRRKAGKPSD